MLNQLRRALSYGLRPLPRDPRLRHEEIVRREYDYYAKMRFQKDPGAYHHDEWSDVSTLLSLTDVKKPNILDVGCGTGRHAYLMKELTANYIGIDISSASLEIARQNNRNAIFHAMSMRDITFPPGRFDGFWSCMSLDHEPKETVLESLISIHRVIRQKGVGCIILSSGTTDGVFGIRKMQSNDYTAEEFGDKLLKANFTIVNQVTKPYEIAGLTLAHRFFVTT